MLFPELLAVECGALSEDWLLSCRCTCPGPKRNVGAGQPCPGKGGIIDHNHQRLSSWRRQSAVPTTCSPCNAHARLHQTEVVWPGVLQVLYQVVTPSFCVQLCAYIMPVAFIEARGRVKTRMSYGRRSCCQTGGTWGGTQSSQAPRRTLAPPVFSKSKTPFQLTNWTIS